MSNHQQFPVEGMYRQLSYGLEQFGQAPQSASRSQARHHSVPSRAYTGHQNRSQMGTTPGFNLPQASMARSHSYAGYSTPSSIPMGNRLNRSGSHRPTRPASSSSRPMNRKASSRSDGMPFVNITGSIAPVTAPAKGSNVAANNGQAWQSFPAMQGMVDTQHMPDVGMSIDQFLAKSKQYLDTTGAQFELDDSYDMAKSQCPSMASGPSLDTPGHADNWLTGLSPGTEFPMIREASSQSFWSDAQYHQDTMFQDPPKASDSPITSMPTALMGISPRLPLQQQPTVPSYTAGLSTLDETLMERSDSNSSNSSTKSSRRFKEREQQVLHNAARNTIAPKPNQLSRPVAGAVRIIKKNTTKNSRAHADIKRVKHPKLFCEHCRDHPEGFRGDHELRRHVLAKHNDEKKRFVCGDPGNKSHLQPKVPLSDCKKCMDRKEYNAYYNAAAHLRRAHFNPRTKTHRGKRGGSGGGDWPHMDDLKGVWIQEIIVNPGEQLSLPEELSQPMSAAPSSSGYHAQADPMAMGLDDTGHATSSGLFETSAPNGMDLAAQGDDSWSFMNTSSWSDQMDQSVMMMDASMNGLNQSFHGGQWPMGI